MILTCKQVNIRFKSQNLHQQRIRYSDYTGASTLSVAMNKDFITVSYLYKSQSNELKPLKVLTFNTNEIIEVESEESLEVLD